MGRKYYFYRIFISFYFTSYSLSLLRAWRKQGKGKARQESFGRIGRQAGKIRAGRDRLAGNGNGRQASVYVWTLFLLYLFFYILLIISSEILLFFYIYVRFVQVLPTYFTQTYHTIPNHTVPYRVVPYLPIYIFDLLSTSALLPYVLNERTDGRANGRTDGRTNEGNAA